MHARYFSAHLGRFLSPNPLGGDEFSPQSWNRYGYVVGNPLKYVDPYTLLEGAACSTDRFLRVGFGSYGGRRVFRIGGQWVQKVEKSGHIDLWRGGPL